MLIDYWSYVQKSYDPNTTHKITTEDILACANAQGVEFKYGDILMIRTGWVDAYNRMEEATRKNLGEVKNYAHTFVGVDQADHMVDFLHDHYFAAVAGDNPAFEAWPTGPAPLHASLLPLWGVPIGEMWDLEKLSERCKAYNQYDFFFTSVPINVKGTCVKPFPQVFSDLKNVLHANGSWYVGGVGSQSNAVAIF